MQETSRILLKSFNKESIIEMIDIIILELKKRKIYFSNLISLPVKKNKFTILISPHVDKNARDQYEIRIYKKFFYIYDNFTKIQQLLSNINLISGVEIDLRELI